MADECEHSGERSMDRATGDEHCQDCGSVNPTAGSGQVATASRWCPDCGTKNPYELGERWTCQGCGVTWVRGSSEGTHLVIEEPGAATMALLRAGLERSGMTFGECVECSRPYGSRNGSELCPPCREPAKYGDDWWQKHPEGSRFTQRARLLSLLLHRGSERLDIEQLANWAAELGETDFLQLAEAALDGDELAWRETMAVEVLRHAPSLIEHAVSTKSEVHVEVRSSDVQG